MTRPFQPISGAATSQSLAVTASSQTLTVPATENVLLTVVGSQTVFFAFGPTATAANSTPLLGNSAQTFSLPGGATLLPGPAQLTFVAAGTGSTVYVTSGAGV